LSVLTPDPSQRWVDDDPKDSDILNVEPGYNEAMERSSHPQSSIHNPPFTI